MTKVIQRNANAGVSACIFIEKLKHRCFSVNFGRKKKNSYIVEHHVASNINTSCPNKKAIFHPDRKKLSERLGS